MAAILFLTMAACSSAPKGDISSDADPAQEANRIEAEVQAGYKAQYDVLAPKEFDKATSSLAEAREQIKDSAKREKISQSLSEAQGYLNKTRDLAAGRQANVQGLLDARTAALVAGARELPKENKSLKDNDDRFRDLSDDATLDPKEFAELKSSYMALELVAIQNTQLAKARAQVASARNNGAKKNTPATLNKAELALTNAESTIAANRNNPADFARAVSQANAAATLLDATLAATKRPDGTVATEEVALSLVGQNSTIKGLKGEISSQGEKMAEANAVVGLDAALEDSRKQFSKDEAEVYREGTNLVIRLKQLNFPTGKTDLPAASLELLAKVRTVAQELNPSRIQVQGHTDSVGGEKANLALSKSRAKAVATYLSSNGLENANVESDGYGFKKPLATNKSKAGRAQNRRVDVIITPGASAKMDL